MSNFDTAFEEVQLLVESFETDLKYFLKPEYSEAQVRLHFIDKFFIALGWDVRNDHRQNPLQREVVIEKTQRQQQSKAQKRADYAFFVAPDFKNVKFFVEAKKPSRNLKNADDYFQTARYGWNAGLGISILTDFEELHIIDCRFKPDINKVFNAHNKTLRYTDYKDKEKFAELYWLFSKEAALAGNIEAYVNKLPKPKKGAAQTTLFGGKWQSIDESFLEYIDGIRETLAKAFKKNDNSLSSELLTEAVQRTIDRLVFIRFLEDKLIEPENYVSEFGNRTTVWKDFINVCRTFDAKYNGVVFKKHFIDDQNFTGADDAHFKSICSELSHLNTPYDFNAIPIHILGSIYERFLGKIVVATDKRVTIEEKPEVRKAGGVYYTPKYIVDYIIQNTIGKLIEGKSPKEIAKLKFADIACGSGSFLIGVLDCLIVYHTKYYNEHIEEAKKDKCLNVDGLYVLSIKQKQKILTNNIYGVDLDHQATEVTQLSLYLKMLEDETTATANEMQVLFHEKILPDLSKNIKCGNSIINTNILASQLFNFKEERKLNPFDFETAFPEVFNQGGFNVIIGNPPYVDIKALNPLEVDYYFKNYKTTENRINLYSVFIEKAISMLDKKGLLGYIIPNSILYQSSYLKLRQLILAKYNLHKIVRVPDNVFIGVKAETAIIILGNEARSGNVDVILFDRKEVINFIDEKRKFTISQETWKDHSLATWDVYGNPSINLLLNKLESNSIPLYKKVDFCLGLTPYDAYKGHTPEQIEKRVFHSGKAKDKTFKKILGGTNVLRYVVDNNVKEYISYGDWLGAPREKKFFTRPRILVRQIVSGNPLRIYAGYTEEELYNAQSIFNIINKENEILDLFLLTAILNSTLMNFYHKYKYLDLSKNLFQKILIQNCKQFPIPIIHLKNIEQKAICDNIISLVKNLLLAKKQQIQTERDKDYLQNKSQGLDRQIDNLVFSLYGLNEEEVKLVLTS